MTAPKRILFVCMGNICRSPAAEGVFLEMLRERGEADGFEVDSAGTLDYHTGELPDPRMRRVGARRGYNFDSRARHFTPCDFDRFDMIIAMDENNLHEIRSLDPRGRHREKVHLLCDFLVEPGPAEVPDPYYGGEEGFERCLDLIERACEGLLTHLRDGKS
ncbi:low molecular weight phosphotyrosine protein phosphatase [Candidatus Sumerlaeota bacterium]|nr:low molecular weight phosphotyrosine protein phosphatase [Candidatus Sumerlaeota bacterium]